MARLRHPNTLFALLVIGYLLYAGAFILRTSPTIDANSYIPETKRYYVLFDDMMISMRYARHWADGHGLVWNLTGERVEGFTNPGWVAWMALWHRVGLDESKTSLPILISGAVFMALTLVVVRRIGDRLSGGNPWVGIGAALFTGFYLPLNIWSLRGTEVSILVLLLAWATLLTLRALESGRVPWGAYMLLGASTLIRMDMAVPLGALTAFMMFNDRKRFWQHAAIGIAVLALFMGPQFALRRWYYGEWLPNTYYLKMAGYPLVLRFLEGLEIFIRLFVRFGPLPFAIFLFRQDRAVRLLAWFATAQMLYSIYVGGDAWEDIGGANRYFALAMPHLFLLLMLTLAAFTRWLKAAGEAVTVGPHRDTVPAPSERALRIGLAILIPSLLVITNYLSTTDSLAQLLLLKPERYSGESQVKVEAAMLLDALTAPDATVALTGVGVIPYFTERTTIDILGKVDKTIAHLPADRTFMPDYKPGHMKWDYAYSIGQLQPDVILEVWLDEQSAYAAMNEQYETVWFPPTDRLVFMRSGSPHIYWDRLR